MRSQRAEKERLLTVLFFVPAQDSASLVRKDESWNLLGKDVLPSQRKDGDQSDDAHLNGKVDDGVDPVESLEESSHSARNVLKESLEDVSSDGFSVMVESNVVSNNVASLLHVPVDQPLPLLFVNRAGKTSGIQEHGAPEPDPTGKQVHDQKDPDGTSNGESNDSQPKDDEAGSPMRLVKVVVHVSHKVMFESRSSSGSQVEGRVLESPLPIRADVQDVES